MKWFRITSPGWQISIVLSLVIFLGWDSMPVPGPDGKVIVELYELPWDSSLKNYKTIAVFTTGQIIFGDHFITIVRMNRKEPIKPLLWVVETFPSVIDHLPRKILCTMRGGWFPEVSLTVEQWKRLWAFRREGKELLQFRLYE